MKGIKVKAVGGGLRWGITRSSLHEIQKLDPSARLSEDCHRVVLSNGEILCPLDTLFEDGSIVRHENIDGILNKSAH